jgi:flagellar protein FliO/FliZ
MVRIVDVVGLDARKRLYVIEVTGRWLLIASSETGIQLVSELDAVTAAAAAAEIAAARPTLQVISTTRDAFAARFARLLSRRR